MTTKEVWANLKDSDKLLYNFITAFIFVISYALLVGYFFNKSYILFFLFFSIFFYFSFLIFKNPKIGIIALIIFLPLHAFYFSYFFSIFSLNVQSSFFLALWKEVIFLILVCALTFKFFRKEIKKPKLIFADKLIIGLFILSLIISCRSNLSEIIWGIRYQFEFFAFYFAVRFLNIFSNTKDLVMRSFIFIGVFVSSFGLFQAILLPKDFLTSFGFRNYNDGWVAGLPPLAYHPVSPPKMDLIRIIGTFSDPNTFGAYLIIFIIFLVSLLLVYKRYRGLIYLAFFPSLISLIYTFSRSAWISLAVGILTLLFIVIPKKIRLKATGILMFLVIVIVLLFPSFLKSTFLTDIILHGEYSQTIYGSTASHFDSLKSGLNYVIDNPLGMGLGKAGPASQRFGAGIISENWYLQIGEEVGILGIILFIGIILNFLWHFWRYFISAKDLSIKYLNLFLFVSLIALSFSNLFLHTWASTAVSFTFWIFTGLLISWGQNENSNSA